MTNIIKRKSERFKPKLSVLQYGRDYYKIEQEMSKRSICAKGEI